MNRYFYSKQAPFALFTVAVLLALVLPDLLQHGMFMDGTQYAIISKNYTEGKSSFWFPFLSSSWNNRGQNYFLEQPPLVYFFQSFFFKAFNGSFLSERMYCLLMLLLSAWLIKLVWELLFNKHDEYNWLSWMPVLFWIITPSVFWSFKNNMHENTLTVFVLASVYFALKSIIANKMQIIFILLSSVCIFLGTLSKGLPALFPFASIVLWKLVNKDFKWSKTILYSFILVLVPAIIYICLMMFNTDAKKSLTFHVVERLIFRIENNQQVENRLTVLFWLFTDLLVPIGLAVIAWVLLKWKGVFNANLKSNTQKKQLFYFTILLGFCGVLPLTLTHVQRAVYFVPAIPFFAMAFSLVLIDPIKKFSESFSTSSFSFKVWRANMVFALVAVIVVAVLSFGKVSRDQDEFYDAMEIAKIVGDDQLVSVSNNQYQEWGFHFYLLRYHQVTMNCSDQKLLYKIALNDELLNDSLYDKVNVKLKKHQLFKRKN